MNSKKREKSREFKCTLCNRTFKSVRALVQHQQALHPRGFKCEICERKFNSQHSLDQHLNAVHNKTFECMWCNKTFQSKKALSKHAKSEHRNIISAKKTLNIEPYMYEPIIIRKRSEDLIDGVAGFKCPSCGCEKGVYNQASEPLFSKRSHILIICSNCGKGFRDTDL